MASSEFSEQSTIKSANVRHFNSTKKIGLLGPFGGGNLGDAAIQKSMIDNIRQFHPQAEIYGFSLQPQDTESRHGIPTYPIGKEANFADYCWWRGATENSLSSKLTNFLVRWQQTTNSILRKLGSRFIFGTLESLAWWRAYQNFQFLELDLLIVSGGGQLDDYWGGAWGHPFTLLRWCLFAKMNDTKFLIVSTGAGPIDSFLGKFFTRMTLSLADYRSYRDADSQQYIEEVVGFTSDDPVYADLAFSLPIDSYQPSPKNSQYQAVVGIGPMSYYHPETWPEKNRSVYSQYLSKLATFIVWLTQQQYAVALFPSQTSHDQLAIDDLQELLIAQQVPTQQIIQQPIFTVDELMNQLADIDMVVASRFHGVLLSLLMNKPTLALSYHPKIDALMADMGQSDYCLSIDDFEVETMKNKFMKFKTDYQQIEQQLAIATQEYQFSLAKQYEYIFKNF